MYCPFPANLDDLEANLRREVANLDPNMLTRALGDMVNRAQLCVANNWGYLKNIEIYDLSAEIIRKFV